VACPELNGRYVLASSQQCPETDQPRPVYVKEADVKDAAEVPAEQAALAQEEGASRGEAGVGPRIFCYFADVKGRKGWYLGKREGGVLTRPTSKKGVLGFSPRKDDVPPKGGWQVKEDRQFVADTAGVCVCVCCVVVCVCVCVCVCGCVCVCVCMCVCVL